MSKWKIAKDFGVDPDGEIVAVVERLQKLSAEERMVVFGFFCKYCGADDPLCQCWNDE